MVQTQHVYGDSLVNYKIQLSAQISKNIAAIRPDIRGSTVQQNHYQFATSLRPQTEAD